MASYGFHPEAADESTNTANREALLKNQGVYLAATRYYLDHASPLVAAAFVAEVEAAIKTLLASPTTWQIIDEPQVRRYLLRRFPYSLYYRWEPEQERVSIYAVMHFSKAPGYWRNRL